MSRPCGPGQAGVPHGGNEAPPVPDMAHNGKRSLKGLALGIHMYPIQTPASVTGRPGGSCTQPSNHSAPKDSKKPSCCKEPSPPQQLRFWVWDSVAPPSHQARGTPALPWDLPYDQGIINWSPGACLSTQTRVHRGCKCTVNPADLSRRSHPAQGSSW